MYGEKNKFKNKYEMVIMIEIKKKGFMISFIDSPKLNMAMISLSLSSLIKAIIKPNIIINGKVTLIKFGIKKKDKKSTFIKSICNLFKYEKSLDICKSHAIDTKIKKTSVQDLII